ncbi:MAG: efflux RND transporter permease subunit [Bacteroidetes bacterium]|nr:efflux RND transporter permease subunit [Bacteroidota bacterium]
MESFIKSIIIFSLRNKGVVIFSTILVFFIGIYSYTSTPIVAFPDFTNTQITIISQWPGKSAQEVERFVTVPVEISMNAVQKKMHLRSRSMYGLSVITIIFEDEVEDMYARQQVTNLLNEIDLPDGVQPTLTPPTGPTDEVYRYTIKSDSLTPSQLRELQDWVVERNIRRVPGVADVVAFGGPVKAYEISVNPQLLQKYNLTAVDVYNAVQSSNVNVGGDVIEKSNQAFVVRGIGLINNIKELENIIVDNNGDVPITVKHVASVNQTARPRLGQVGMNEDGDAVEAIILMRKGADPGPILKGLDEQVKNLNENKMPPRTKVVPYYNRQELIDLCTHTVIHNVTEGILLIPLILMLFLFNWRAVINISVVIPLSFLFAFIGLKMKGMFANLISIGALDFGIIIDGAVVMVEGIFVVLALKAEHVGMEKYNKLSKLGLIKKVSLQSMKAIFFSQLIIITALIPIFSFQKVEGKIFSPLAFNMSFALLGGIIFTLTIIPVLSSIFFKKNVKERHNPFLEFILKNYARLYDFSFKHKKPALAAITLFVVAGISCFAFLGTEFLPHLNEGKLWVRAQAPFSVSLTESRKLADSIRVELSQFKEVENVISQTGRPDDGTDPKGFFNVETYVDLYPQDEWLKGMNEEKLIDSMSNVLNRKHFGIVWNFSQPILDNVEEAVAGIPASQAIKLYGENLQTLDSISEVVISKLKNIEGIEDLGSLQSMGQPELSINLDQQKMALYGVTTQAANAVIEMAVGGKQVSKLYEGERKFDIRVRYQYPYRKSETEIGELMVPNIKGGKLPLKEIADIKYKNGPAFIYRDNNTRYVAVKFSIRGRDLGATIQDAQNKVKEIKFAKGYTIEWAGEYESQQRASKRLAVVVPICLLIIFIILYFVFKNVKDILVVFINVPFALTGGILGLLISKHNFSISAGIGFVALFGVCIQNGVILLTVFRQKLEEKLPLLQAVREGSISRVRPVLMTALIAILGLTPAALSHGIGSETQRPFAIVIISGLIASTALVLIVLPIVFYLVHRKNHD